VKFLKFLYYLIKKDLKDLKIKINRFSQSVQRNIKPRENLLFLNLTYMDLLLNNSKLKLEQKEQILGSNNKLLIKLMDEKIKNLFQFTFLKSNYFASWIKNPLDLEIVEKSKEPIANIENNDSINSYSDQYLMDRPNLKSFMKNNVEYTKYKQLLIKVSCGFICAFS